MALLSVAALFLVGFWHGFTQVTQSALGALNGTEGASYLSERLGADVARASSATVAGGTLTLAWQEPDGTSVSVSYSEDASREVVRQETVTPPGGGATTTTQIVARGLSPGGLSFTQPAAREVSVDAAFPNGGTLLETFSEAPGGP